MGETKKHAGHAVVALGEDGIIYCDLYGYITGDIVKESMRQTAELVRQQRLKGEKLHLVIDVSQIISQTSEARIRAKEVGTFGLDKLAVVGASRMLATVGHYIVEAGGMAGYTQFFRTRVQAQNWIKRGRIATPDTSIAERNVNVALACIICISVLVGWIINNTTLTSFLPGLSAMSPVSAVVMLLLGGAILCLKRGAIHGWRKRVAIGAGIASLAYGVLLIGLSYSLSAQLTWLPLSGKLLPSAGVPQGTTLNFILLGGMFLAIASGQKHVWQKTVFHICSVVLFIITISSIISISFSGAAILGGIIISMSLAAALSFLFLNHALQTVTHPLPLFASGMRFINRNWQPVTVLLALLLCVGLAWQQSLRDMNANAVSAIDEEFSVTETALKERFGTTINTLQGFKGFFEASDFVSAAEYANYYVGAKPEGGYPGFTAISFTRSVPENAQQAYINSMRQQAGTAATPKQFANLRVFPETNAPTRYPVTYVQPFSDTTNFGFDSGVDPERRAGFEKARDTGSPTATDTINLNVSRPNEPPRYGFVISIPVYTLAKGETPPTTVEQRRAKIYGFVNSVFDNNVLFSSVFKPVADSAVKYTLTDVTAENIVYTHNGSVQNLHDTPTRTTDLTVAGRDWRLAMYTPQDFGTTGAARFIPAAILGGGTVLAFLTAGLILSLGRQRQHALQLASDMTQDLNKERDAAIVAQQKDEAILSSIGDAVFAIDIQGRITLFNPAAELSSGYTHEEAVGKYYKDILKFIFEKDRTINDRFIKKALSGHLGTMQNHTKLIRKDGTEIYVSDSAAPIYDAENNIVGAIIVFRDVSEDYALDQAKSEFVSLASHQLRTPLSAVNWTAEMLLDGTMGKMTKDQTAQVQEIYDGNQRMIELVNSLLDVSRLELGRLVNIPVPTDMTQVADSLEKELMTTITGKNLTFEKHISHNLAPISADPKLLRMVLQNLLSNAVKYTPANGKVTLAMRPATQAEITREKAASGQPYMLMSVGDTGYGIPKEQQGHIFQKMFRADNVRKMDVEGTGLGLYIVREIVLKLGGTIRFESKESLGTTFYVLLPFTTKATQLPGEKPVVK